MFYGSEAYHKLMGRWSERLAPQLIKFADVQDGNRVLDVGTGTGSVALAVSAAIKGGEIVGADPALAYVEHAKSRSTDPRLHFQVADAMNLPFSPNSFDRCLSCLVLNFVPDTQKAVSEMCRVARPEGMLAACIWDYGDGMEMLRIFWDAVVALDPAAESRDERHMPYCRKGELRDLWEVAGLHQVEEIALMIPFDFSSFDDFWQPFLTGQGPSGSYAANLAPDKRDRLRGYLRERLLGDRSDCAFTLKGRAWAVKGQVQPD